MSLFISFDDLDYNRVLYYKTVSHVSLYNSIRKYVHFEMEQNRFKQGNNA